MKSPPSCHHAAASEKANNVGKSRKRPSAGTAKVDFERQVHHFSAANVAQKRGAGVGSSTQKKAAPTTAIEATATKQNRVTKTSTLDAARLIEATGTKRSYGGGVDCNNAKKKRKVKGTKGYYKNPSGTFRVQIRRFGKDMNFGTYPNEQEAKLACAIAKNKLELSKKVQHELTPIDKKVLQSIRTEVKTIIKAATLEEKELLIATYRLSASVDDETAEEQVVSDNDEFSLFDLSIEHDTVIENDIDDDGAPPPTKPPPTPNVVSAQVDGESQVASSPPSASPPQVFDILNIGTDHFSIIRLSLFNEMTAKELQKFCLKTVGLCDYFAKNDGKMYFALKPGPTLKPIENNKYVFKALIDKYCPPLSALVAILESNGCLLNLYPLLLLGQLHMHADRKINYPVGGVIERWCLNITDKNMQLQQQGNRGNHVVFPCGHGNFVCMSDTVRGIVDIADGVRLQHGCPKLVMEAVGSKASITIVMDLCFGSQAVKNTVLEQVLSRFTSAVPSDSNSNSIQSLREVATTAVATRSPILLQDIDPNGIVKDAIDEKKALLLSTCARYQCNEKTDEGTRYCTTCVQGNKECCVEKCKNRRHSHERDCLYCLYHKDPKTRYVCDHCNKRFSTNRGLRYHVDNNVCGLYHSDRKTRCAKCLIRGRPDGSSLCSDCNLLCRKSGCTNVLAQGDPVRCSDCRTNNWWETSVDGVTRLCSTSLVTARKKKPAPTYEQIQQEIARHQAKVKQRIFVSSR